MKFFIGCLIIARLLCPTLAHQLSSQDSTNMGLVVPTQQAVVADSDFDQVTEYVHSNPVFDGTKEEINNPIAYFIKNYEPEYAQDMVQLFLKSRRYKVTNADIQLAMDAQAYEILKLLVGAGGTVDSRDSDGWTPLMHAAYEGNIAKMSYLMAHRADVNAQDRDGRTVLQIAAEYNYAAAHLLLTNGAWTHGEYGLKAFNYSKKKAIKELLCAYGAIDMP